MPLLRSVYKRQCDGFVCSFMHSPSGITSSGEASPEEQPTWRGTEVSDPQPCEEFGWERILQPQSSPQNLQLPVRLDCTSWRLSAEPHSSLWPSWALGTLHFLLIWSSLAPFSIKICVCVCVCVCISVSHMWMGHKRGDWEVPAQKYVLHLFYHLT